MTMIRSPYVVTNTVAGGVSVFLMAPPGGWKTSWACQWPGICFISFANEQGDHAITNYPKVAQWFMANNKNQEVPPVFNTETPQFFRVRSTDDMEKVIEDICKNHKQWKVSTVCVDLIQYYISIWAAEYYTLKYKSDKKWAKLAQEHGGEAMDPQAWGFLNTHIDGLRVKLANEGLNTIWTCHSKEVWEPREDKPSIKELKAIVPHIQGGTRLSLPGATSLHLAAEMRSQLHSSIPGREFRYPVYWTMPNKYLQLRHKYFDAFPQGRLIDPDFGELPTFRAVWNAIGKYIYICP